MQILHNKIMPNGAATTVHKIASMAWLDNNLSVTMNSYIDDQTDLIAWQDSYDFGNPSLVGHIDEAVLNWMVGPDGPFSGGSVIETPTHIDIAKRNLKNNLARLFDAEMRGGFAVSAGPLAGEILQSTSVDMVNWQNSLALYSQQVTDGFGDVVGAIIRTRSNTNYEITYNEAVIVLTALTIWRNTMLTKSWALKDQIDACQTVDELVEIVITFDDPEPYEEPIYA